MTTYDPLSIAERPRVSIFAGLPSAPPGSVLVVDREGQPLVALERPGDRLTAGEARWGQVRTLYTVDVSEHRIDFSGTFPSADDVGGFRAEVVLNVQVTDPVAVVQRGLRDVAGALVPLVTETLRRSCEQFPAEACDQAERAGLVAVREREAEQRHDSALRICNVHLVLRLDDAAARYVHDRKEVGREAELRKLRVGFDQERLLMQQVQERLQAQLEDQRQQLQLEREAARQRAEQQLFASLELERVRGELERAEHVEQLELRRLQARLERERLEVEQLTSLLEKGEYVRLGLQLAQDPQAIHAINQHIAEQRSADTEWQMRALRLFLESDGLEGFQVTEQAKRVLQGLIETWSARGSLPSAPLPEQRSVEAGDPPQVIDLDKGSRERSVGSWQVFPGDDEQESQSGTGKAQASRDEEASSSHEHRA